MRLSAVILLLTACNGPDPKTTEPGLAENFGEEETLGVAGCDNLLPDHCFYPFPSRAFVDAEGYVALPTEAVPEPDDGAYTTESFTTFRGFGAASPIVVRLPGAALPDGVGPFDPTPSLGADAVTVLLDAATGERIPHWLEPDVRAVDADPPVWVLRPSIPLPRGTEVVVGIRGLSDENGAAWAAPPAFAALRDQTASQWIGIHDRRAHYEDVVFPALEAAGFARGELQLAWSFPTRAADESTARFLSVRDAIFAALPAGGPAYTLDTVLTCDAPGSTADCPEGIRVIVDGTVEVPSVMLPADALGVRHVRVDAAGNAVVEGVERWPFRLQIPYVAYEGDAPVPVLQYGHGFLGSYGEANGGWLRAMAERKGFVILATSMQGMNEDDVTVWLRVLLGDGGQFPYLADLAMQGVVNQLVLQRMMRTSLAADTTPALYREDGALAWDPDTLWYHGNSQGGSVGTIVMATSNDVSRGVLGVPGSGYPFLLHRSTVFDEFDAALKVAYEEPDSVARFLALLGTGWDDFDPLTFAPHLHGNPLPGTMDHEVLLHVAKEDQQVVNEASFILGRAAGSVLMTPAVRGVYGLPEEAYPASPGSALVEVDFGIPDDPTPLTPADGDPADPEGSDTHGWLRKWEPAQDQAVHFLQTGEIIDVCGGAPCVTDGEP